MTFTTAIRTCFAKYVTFSGRASRSEYWWFFLFVLLMNTAAGIVDMALFGTVAVQQTADSTAVAASWQQPVQAIVSLVLFLPQLSAAWRRMHDTGRSGLYALFPILLMICAGLVLVFGIGLASHFQHGGSLDLLFTRATLIVLIPTLVVLFLSPLLVIWWLTRPSQPGTNEYGPNPHEVTQ